MSLAHAMGRIAEIQAKASVLMPLQSLQTTGFEQVLQTANNNFDNGPDRYQIPHTYPIPTGPVTANTGASASAASAATIASHGTPPTVPASMRPMFSNAAAAHGVPVTLALAVGAAESGFRAGAKSGAGAQGVMQLMPATAAGLGVADSKNPAENINGGVKYLAQMLKRFDGDTSLALAAYNAGPGAVEEHDGIPPYAETQAYVSRVLSYANHYGSQPANGLQ